MSGVRYGAVELAALPSMRVACCRVVSGTPENDVWRRMQAWAEQRKLPEDLRNLGFDVPVTPEQQAAGLRGYELWLVLPPAIDHAEDLAEDPVHNILLRSFAGGLYARMVIYDPFADPFVRIPAGWSRLHRWVADHRLYEAAEHQFLEEVIAGADGQRDMLIYYPVAAIAEGVPA